MNGYDRGQFVAREIAMIVLIAAGIGILGGGILGALIWWVFA